MGENDSGKIHSVDGSPDDDPVRVSHHWTEARQNMILDMMASMDDRPFNSDTHKQDDAFLKGFHLTAQAVAGTLTNNFSSIDRNGDGVIDKSELRLARENEFHNGDLVTAAELIAALRSFELISRLSNDQSGFESGISKMDINKLNLNSVPKWSALTRLSSMVANSNRNLMAVSTVCNGVGIAAAKTGHLEVSGGLLAVSGILTGAAMFDGNKEYRNQKHFLEGLY